MTESRKSVRESPRNLLLRFRASVTAIMALQTVLYFCAGGCGSSSATDPKIFPPSIVSQPESRTVTANQTATFTVAVTGTPPLSYQWRKNGANIAGATAASYMTPSTTMSDSGSTFDVVVSNTAGAGPEASATPPGGPRLSPSQLNEQNAR